MVRSKPHALRKGLFVLNLMLLIGIGLGIWSWVLTPAPAEASVADADRVAWMTARQTGLRWQPTAPVSDDAFRRQFLRFDDPRVAHWPFSGPLPPAPTPVGEKDPARDDEPRDLSELGAVRMVILGEGEPVVGFTFRAPTKYIVLSPGEFFRRSPREPARFRLTGVEPIDADVHHVYYEVLEEERVLHEAHLVWQRKLGCDRGGGLGPCGPHEDDAYAPKPPAVRVSVVTLEGLRTARPVRHINPRNHRDRVVEFDRQAYDATRGKGAEALLTLVKTQAANDPATGRPMGLRIVGHDGRLPADRFDVRKGDILLSIAGQKVTSRADALRIAQTLDPDTLVPVVIDRRGVLYTYRVDARDPRTKRAFRYFDTTD